MKENIYSFTNNILNKNQISEINKIIHKNFINNSKDCFATCVIKSSQVKFR